jgi:hypothetical protein
MAGGSSGRLFLMGSISPPSRFMNSSMEKIFLKNLLKWYKEEERSEG